MHDEDQTFVPESFLELYRDRRHRLTVTREHLVQRYELCEDMSTLLMEPCQANRDGGLDPQELQERGVSSLLEAPLAALSSAEADWVMHRTFEQLGWPWPNSGPAKGQG